MDRTKLSKVIKESWWYKLRIEDYPIEWIQDDLSYFRQAVKNTAFLIPSLKVGALGVSMLRLYLKGLTSKKKMRQRSLKTLKRKYGKLGYVYFVAYVSMKLRSMGFTHEQVRRHLVFSLSIFPVMPLCAVFIAYEKYVMNRRKYEDGGEGKVLSKIPENLRPYAVLFAEMPEILRS